MKENKKEMIKPLATGLLASGQFMNASYDDRGFPRPAAALRCGEGVAGVDSQARLAPRAAIHHDKWDSHGLSFHRIRHRISAAVTAMINDFSLRTLILAVRGVK